MTTAPGIEISRRSEADRAPLESMYASIFGQKAADDSRERWRWQYEKNPNCPPEGPEIWVARQDGRVLGQYATMPVRLKVLDRTLKASWGMDVMVDPSLQRKGIGSRLFLYWDRQVEASLGLGLSVQSYTLFKKLSWEDVGPVPCYTAPVDLRALLGRRLGGAAAIVAPIASTLRFLFVPNRRTRGSSEVRVEALSPERAFGAEYDELWERVAPAYDFITERKSRYLQWKYREVPYVRYDVFEARREGKLEGFIVLRATERNGAKIGIVIDLLAHPEDKAAIGALIDRAYAWARDEGAVRLQVFTFDRRIAARLASKGFISIKSPMQFCLRVHSDHVDEGFFRDTSRWHVSFGDSDQDRDA